MLLECVVLGWVFVGYLLGAGWTGCVGLAVLGVVWVVGHCVRAVKGGSDSRQ